MLRKQVLILLYKLLPTLLFVTGTHNFVIAQSGNCHPATPFYSVDLSSDPNGTWISPVGSRSNLCCGNSSPNRCVEFSITLSPDAVAINFQIASGAIPPGAMFYQVNCGTPIPVGSPICLDGPGPYTITFCKPGNNPNSYAITSIGAPQTSPDTTVGDGCSTNLWVSGVSPSSISWTSIYPGVQGAYNSYLSCVTGCTSPTVTPTVGHPPYVDYRVCGTPLAAGCIFPSNFCDTIRVYMSPPLVAAVTPNPASFCANNPSILLTGSVSGGVPPYTYIWTNASNGGGNIVSNNISYTATVAGNYSFIVLDQNYPNCPSTIINVPVTANPIPIVNAGPTITTCGSNIQLNGSISGATGGIWSGGSGNFMPGNLGLSPNYTPSSSELATGFVTLTLTSTGNGACSPASDQVTLFVSPPLTASIIGSNVLCAGQSTTLTANITGGTGPFTYLWNTGATTQSITTSNTGIYSVTITGAGPTFCTTTANYIVNASPPINVSASPNTSILCSSTSTISASATGGTGTLNYLWNTGETTPSINVNTGTYIVTVSDASGCMAYDTISVTANSTLLVSLNQPSILCTGQLATLVANTSGGAGGNSFLWSTGATGTSITVGAGNYCVTVTDNVGCNATACSSVQLENIPLTVSIPTPPIICNGSTTTVNATASGGHPPYSYLWNTGNTNQSLTSGAGIYTVTVTDSVGCSYIASVSISQSQLLTLSTSSTPPSCFGNSDGSATVVASGGTPNYSYAWFPFGGNSSTATNLTSGTYTVSVLDSKSCSTNVVVNIIQPQTLTATTIVAQNVTCHGASNGVSTVNPFGGTAPYNYLWTPGGATTQTVNTLNVGTYTITVTDNKGCLTTTQTNITEPSVLSASTSSISNVTCNGGNNGSASINVSGGTPNYSYSWFPFGGTSNSATGLTAGNYTVTITDASNCILQHAITINQPIQLNAGITSSTNVSCNGGNNGSVIATATGGTAPYAYLWNTTPVQTTSMASNLSTGNYFVTITDANNCSATSSSVMITAPTLLTITASPNVLISCDSTIDITSTASGGTGSYSFLWNTGATTSSINTNTGTYIITVTDINGCTASDTVSVQATNSTLAVAVNQPPNICNGSTTSISAVVTGGLGDNTYLWNTGATTPSVTVGAGGYCVTVTDAGGCITTNCVVVVENPLLSLSITSPVTICPNDFGIATTNASGGQAPYTFLWNTGETTNFVTKPAGTYTVTLTDVTGLACAKTAIVNIVESQPLNISISHTDVGCFGDVNGSATAYVSGGTPNYAYLWQPTNSTTSNISNLAPATYTLNVTDSLGCIESKNVTINQPASPIVLSITATNNLCYGDATGSATASVSGGSAPYYFLWSVVGDTTNSVSNLYTGTYIATVADTTGCFVADTITIQQPTELTINAISEQINCYGQTGAVLLSANGGISPYTFSGNSTTNLVAGTYNYIVTDFNGCKDTTQATINQGPSLFELTATASPITCFGQTTNVDITITGGIGTIIFSGDDTLNLGAGTYNYLVTDSSGCSAQNQIVINPPPPDITLSLSNIQNACYDSTNGAVSVDVNGGVAPYQYFWSNGATTNNISSLTPDTYTIIVTDNNGCTKTDSAIIMETTEINLSLSNVVASKCNLNNGTATINTLGGTAPYVYSWFPNVANSNFSDSLYSGSYTVTVSDANGCQKLISVLIDSSSFIVANFNNTSVCLNNTTIFSDSSYTSAGNNVVSWEWNFGDNSPIDTTTNPSHIYLSSGNYITTLTVQSSDGCISSINNTVQVHQLPIANFTSSNVCFNEITSFTDISTEALNDTINSWLWNFGDNSAVSSLQSPTHTYTTTGSNTATLIVTSSLGCKDSISKPVIVYPIPVVQFTVADTSGCFIHCTNFVDITDTLGFNIVNWEWDFGDGSATFVSTIANAQHCFNNSGAYNVSLTVTSAQGCSTTYTENNAINVYNSPIAAFNFSPESPVSISNSEIYFNNLSQESTLWNWNFGDNTNSNTLENPTHLYSKTGNYCITLIATNENQCADTTTSCIEILPDFTFFIPNAFSPFNSQGINDKFSGYGTNIDEYEMWIFDRWGNMIFYTNDLDSRWDGRANGGDDVAQRDVYVYLVKIVDFKGDSHEYRGIVTLVR